jgi:RNA polymerase sigma-70 factor (ECF subfamily)
MPASLRDEAVLVEHAVAGNADAFGRLYECYLDAIYRYVYFRTGDNHDAEDLTEQVFLKAWEALPGYKQCGKPFSSWLYRIAHNIVVDYHRRQTTAPLMLEEGYSDQEPTALDRVIKAEEMAALAQAIAQLPEDQQQMIVLRFVEGLDHTTVARIMDKTEGACRVLQHRTLAALSDLLDGVRRK